MMKSCTAPMSLVTYEEVRPYARAIDQRLVRRDDDWRLIRSRLRQLRPARAGAPHRRGRHAVEILELFPIPVPFKIRHEEQMVLPDRAAGRVAVLVPFERRLRGGRLRRGDGRRRRSRP